MDSRVAYDFSDGVATIVMNDGNVNALSNQMFAGLNAAFDHAESDGAIVVLSGRDERFSAGFDLNALASGGTAAIDMLRSGFELSYRMLSFPRPVVIACTGHAIAMASFLLLSGDYRLGADGPFKITANEVAIGLTMPLAAVEICRQRLAPAHYNRAMLLSEVYSPAAAIDAGFLDRIVPPAELAQAARDTAEEFLKLDANAHTGTKLRAREHSLAALRTAIDSDDAALRAVLSTVD